MTQNTNLQGVNKAQVAAARTELERCLRQLVELFPDPDFRAHPPDLVIDTGYPPVPEVPLETEPHLITLYRRDLLDPKEWTLAVLLHKMVHTYHWYSLDFRSPDLPPVDPRISWPCPQ